MAAPQVDAETLAEAWRLAQPKPVGEGLSTRAIALRMGISKTTAADYVKRGEEVAPWIEVLGRAEQQGSMATRLLTVLFKAYARAEQHEHDEDPATWLAISKFAADREAQLATLLGLNQPSRVAIGRDDGPRRVPDPEVMAAVARAARANEVDERELRRGRPGVIEGSAGD